MPTLRQSEYSMAVYVVPVKHYGKSLIQGMGMHMLKCTFSFHIKKNNLFLKKIFLSLEKLASCY